MTDPRPLPVDGLQVETKPEMVTNPYSGETVELPPDAVAVYDFIKGAEVFGEYVGMQKGLDWFREYFPKEYYVLLD